MEDTPAMPWPFSLNALTTALLPTLACGLVGCSAYDSRFQFAPKPAEVVAYAGETAGDPGVRTLASILGLRNPPLASSQPAVIELAVRIENQTDKPVTFDPAGFQLVSGDLRDFAAPTLAAGGAGPIGIDPKQTWSAVMRFAFPPGVRKDDVNLDGLNLRWALTVDGKTTTHSVSFTRRIVRSYYDDRWHSMPYYYYDPFYGHHRHHLLSRWYCR